MKFLIIRFSSIGDIVLTTPVVRCLKQQVPGAIVHFLTKKSFISILEANPYIDKVIFLSYSWELMMHELQIEEYDCIIDLHHNLRTWKIKHSLYGIKSISFNKLNIQKWLLTALKINRMPAIHIVDRYLETVKGLGVINDGKGLDYFIPSKEKIIDKDLPASHLFGYVGVVIGAALSTKKLPISKLQQLCDQIKYPIVLLGGKEDQLAGDEIASIDPIRIYNSCGRFSLNESADLVLRAKLIISHDTGLMHIAAAFKKPIISVWGNTVPQFGMDAYYGEENSNKDSKFEVQHLNCRPCSKIGYKKCPRKHFKCMQLQDINQMATTASQQVLYNKEEVPHK